MQILSRLLRSKLLRLLGSVALLIPVCHASGISASATYTDMQISPGLYQYNLTLDNTGTTTIGTFWFGWVPGAGFLSAIPTDLGNPSGWSSMTTNGGDAIQWTTTTNLLAPDATLSGFSFESTETPAQLLLDFTGTGTGAGDPVTTSFVYISTPRGDPGFQLVATPTPEPESFVLMLSGMLGVPAAVRLRRSPAD